MSFEDAARRMSNRHPESAWPQAVPNQNLERFQQEALREERSAAATKDIVIGLLLLVVGLVITAATYSSAAREGGTYVVAYGPVIFGAIRIFRGLTRLT